MVSCRILMFIVVINIGIEASPFTKSEEHQPLDLDRVASLMESLEKIDRRISESSREVRDDFSRFRLKVTGRLVHLNVEDQVRGFATPAPIIDPLRA